MAKQIYFEDDAKRKLQSGVNQVAKAVGSTMGPGGKTVIISNHFSIPPSVTKDGVSVADSIILEDPIENIGAQMVRRASSKTYKDAGDGTTQTAVLAQSIINAGLKQVAAGGNPQEIKRGMEKAVDKIVERLTGISRDIGDDNEMLRSIATTSANNDTEIGGLFADVYAKIGKHGLVHAEPSGTIHSSIEVIDGYEMPRGYISPDFATDPKKRAVHEKAFVLVADYTIHTMKDIQPLLAQMEHQKMLTHPLIIIAQDYEGEFYSSMLINHRNGNLRCCLAKAPAAYRKEYMEDIAVITGATVIRDENGMKLQSANPTHLGSADKVIVSEYSTTIIGGGGKPEWIEDLKLSVKVQLDEIKDEDLKLVWEKRLAKIGGCVGVIRIGSATDVELGEKMDRVDDARRSVKSAIEEGVVVGGGVALLRCLDWANNIPTAELHGDEKIGVKIIKDACFSPLEKMLQNAGISSDSIVKDVYTNDSEPGYGYNIKTGKSENLLKAGVLDPTKVIRCALQNASSVAAAVITSDCIVVEVAAK